MELRAIFILATILLVALIVTSLCMLWQPKWRRVHEKQAYLTAVASESGFTGDSEQYVQTILWSTGDIRNENCCGRWSLNEENTAWVVPVSGDYLVNYQTVTWFTDSQTVSSFLTVDGLYVLRSFVPNTTNVPTGTMGSQTLSKTFMVFLEKDSEIGVNVLTYPPVDTYLETGPAFKYATTLTAELKHARCENECDTQADFVELSPTPSDVLPPFAADLLSMDVQSSNLCARQLFERLFKTAKRPKKKNL